MKLINKHKMKSQITLFIIAVLVIGNSSVFAQIPPDGWDDRELPQYENAIEKARKSLHFTPGYTALANGSNLHAFIDPVLAYNGGQAVTDGDFNYNYIRHYTPIGNNATTLSPVHNAIDYEKDWHEEIVYYDGLGREIQNVVVKGAASGADIIQNIEYDGFGRMSKEFLPYAINQEHPDYGPGGLRTDAATEAKGFYATFSNQQDGQFPFAEKEYDGSPLNRIMEQSAPGSDWQIQGGHVQEFNYVTNLSSDNIKYYKVNVNDELIYEGAYSPNNLQGVYAEDENGNKSIEFKNQFGELILKRMQNDGQWLSTYYVYDDYGMLRYVVPPKADALFSQSNTTLGTYETNTDIDQLCYYYDYDKLNRMTLKKLPGAKAVFMLYNERDLPVLIQDGELRLRNQWMFKKYDAHNREIISGIHQFPAPQTPEQMQVYIDAAAAYESYDPNSDYGYTNNAYPSLCQSDFIGTINYYDNYDFLQLSAYTNDYAFRSSHLDFALPNTNEVKGLQTGTRTSIIPNNSTVPLNGNMLQVDYYNKYGHLIQTVKDNHLEGLDIISNKTNYTGQVLIAKESHQAGQNATPIEIAERFEYDHLGNITRHLHSVNGADTVNLYTNRYDDLNRLRIKKLHVSSSGCLQNIDYTYNIRGWLTGINKADQTVNDAFACQLEYNTNATAPQFNGNIASIRWKSAMYPELSAYQYYYDDINRIESATYNINNKYSTAYTYDRNGNILSLKRRGDFAQTSANGIIDQMDYSYSGNQLIAVNDITAQSAQLNGFTDNGSFLQQGEYAYDDNGNMTLDKNKQISGVSYNYLNLPDQIDLEQDEMKHIFYAYDALGRKLQKTTYATGYMPGPATDYCGSFVYSDGNLQFVQHAEGRLVPRENGGFDYQYYLKDHLGNTRVTLSQNGTVLQKDAYYPFGMNIAGLSYSDASPENKYKYNGKELQDDFGLNWYDYGARFYDPSVGRWYVVDPMAHLYFNWSPYNYTLNNPIRFIDPDGTVVDDPPWVYGQLYADSQKKGHITKHDIKKNAIGAAAVGTAMVGAFAIALYGIQAVATYVAIEVVETTVEEVTGVPVITGVDDVIQQGGKKLAKEGGEKMLKEGSEKLAKSPSIKEQALDVKTNLNDGKNSVTVETPNKKVHYDLDGATHKGVETPHKQYSNKNTNPETGQTHWNKDRKTVEPMNQQDIRTVKKVLDKRNGN